MSFAKKLNTALIELHDAGVQGGARIAHSANGQSQDSQRWLVRGVSFRLEAGAITTLIGPNGAGKSTTAKLALGLLQPSEGRVKRKAGLRIGYVPQKLQIDWSLPLSVDRFMRLTGRPLSRDIDEALAETGCEAMRHADLATLSGGEFQRVLLARALARKPDLLVLDEPVQGVDYQGESELYSLIGQARDRLQCGVLLISHDLHVVMAQTDQVICLNGHMCCHGSPLAVAESDEYQRLFGGAGVSTHALYRHEHNHRHLDDGRVLHADGTITENCDDPSVHKHEHTHDIREKAGSDVG